MTGDFVFVSNSRGIRLKFDDISTVYLTLDDTFLEIPVQGLCGNYNGKLEGKANDMYDVKPQTHALSR